MAIAEELRFVEKKFAALHQSTEDELKKGILIELGDTIDRELPIEKRIVALETLLAMQFYLHQKRSESAIDPEVEKSEAALARRFSDIFADEEHRLESLYRYCDENRKEYFRQQRPEEWEDWCDLAGKIKKQII